MLYNVAFICQKRQKGIHTYNTGTQTSKTSANEWDIFFIHHDDFKNNTFVVYDQNASKNTVSLYKLIYILNISKNKHSRIK